MKNINPLFEDNEDDSNASAKNDAVDSKGKDSSNGKDSNEKKDDEKKDDEKKDDEETLPIKFIKCWMFGSSGKWVKDVTAKNEFADESKKAFIADLDLAEQRLGRFIFSRDKKYYELYFIPGKKMYEVEVAIKNGDEFSSSKKKVQKKEIDAIFNSEKFKTIAASFLSKLKLVKKIIPELEKMIIDGSIEVNENKFEAIKKYINDADIYSAILNGAH